MATTVEDVYELASGANLLARLNSWIMDRSPAITTWSQGYVYQPVEFDLINNFVETAPDPLSHPIYRGMMGYKSVRDCYTPWPITFLFHRMRQETGLRIPDAVDFWRYLVHPSNRDDWAQPMYDAAVRGDRLEDDMAKRVAYARAMKAWQSCLREMHLIAKLHDLGIPAHFHPIADVCFATDGWWGHHLWALHVTGPMFARKLQPEHIFPDTYEVHHFHIGGRRDQGVWTANVNTLQEAFGHVPSQAVA